MEGGEVGIEMNDLSLKDAADGGAGPSSHYASEIPPGQDTAQHFVEVNEVTGSMAEIRNRLLTVQHSNEFYWTVTEATAMNVWKDKMDEDLHGICTIAGELRGKVEALDRSNAANRQIMNCEAGSTTDRARMSVTSNVKQRLRELVVEFQDLGRIFQGRYRDVVQTRLVTVSVRDKSVIIRLIEAGDNEQIAQLFQDVILAQGRGPQGQEVLYTIAEIRERHAAIKDFEKKLLELHQIFLHMGILVEAQGRPVDNIEPEVDPPVDAQDDLEDDNEFDDDLQEGNGIIMCLAITIMILGITVAIILFVLF